MVRNACRADGLRVHLQDSPAGQLAATIEGEMSGEVVIQAPAADCVTIAYAGGETVEVHHGAKASDADLVTSCKMKT
jgi:hypothetical protein